MEWKDNVKRKRFPQKLWYPDNYLSRYSVYKFKTGIRTVKRYRRDKTACKTASKHALMLPKVAN